MYLSTSMTTAMQALYPCVLSMLITGISATHGLNTAVWHVHVEPVLQGTKTWRIVELMHNNLFVLRVVPNSADLPTTEANELWLCVLSLAPNPDLHMDNIVLN